MRQRDFVRSLWYRNTKYNDEVLQIQYVTEYGETLKPEEQRLFRSRKKEENTIMNIITGGVTAAKGFQAASAAAGIKYQGRTDMAMVYSEAVSYTHLTLPTT